MGECGEAPRPNASCPARALSRGSVMWPSHRDALVCRSPGVTPERPHDFHTTGLEHGLPRNSLAEGDLWWGNRQEARHGIKANGALWRRPAAIGASIGAFQGHRRSQSAATFPSKRSRNSTRQRLASSATPPRLRHRAGHTGSRAEDVPEVRVKPGNAFHWDIEEV
jgi:hypothetical protein